MAEQIFDLLGDPIPEGFGKRGRPQHMPTQQNRNKVILLQAVGWPDARIAHALAITKPTLKKHYFRELRARYEARDRVDASLMQRCWDEAQKGNVGAIKEFGKMLERADLMKVDFAKPAVADEMPAEKLGKKAEQQRAAEEAHKDSGWGKLLEDEPPARAN